LYEGYFGERLGGPMIHLMIGPTAKEWDLSVVVWNSDHEWSGEIRDKKAIIDPYRADIFEAKVGQSRQKEWAMDCHQLQQRETVVWEKSTMAAVENPIAIVPTGSE
jgi:hypothetical protein